MATMPNTVVVVVDAGITVTTITAVTRVQQAAPAYMVAVAEAVEGFRAKEAGTAASGVRTR
jgi:tRNA(Ile2) C34 agmatinyltransferase TiaS